MAGEGLPRATRGAPALQSDRTEIGILIVRKLRKAFTLWWKD